jgi:Uncharacterised protein conserved in bacteria (DUF2336)
VLHLFLSSAARLNDNQICVFDDVLVRLIEHIEAPSLVQLSSTLSTLSPAPQQAIRRLACHKDIAVAAPMLLRSLALSSTVLVEIASHLSRQHLLVISCRRTLDEALTDILLKRGDVEICRVLAKNAGAKFSEGGYAAIVAAAEPNKDIAESLVFRPDLPPAMLRELLSKATDAVRLALLKAAPPKLRQCIREALDDIASHVSQKAPEPVVYSEAYARIVTLNNSGQVRCPHRGHRAADGRKKLRRPDRGLSRRPAGLANGIVDYPQPKRSSALRTRARARKGKIRKTLPFRCPANDTLRASEPFGHQARTGREGFRDDGECLMREPAQETGFLE